MNALTVYQEYSDHTVSGVDSIKESQLTLISVQNTLHALGQRFRELAEKNARLRAESTDSVKRQREMIARHQSDIAALQQRSKTAKEGLNAVKQTVTQTTSETQKKTLAATESLTKATGKATQASNDQIAVIKQQLAVTHDKALIQQAKLFQKKILSITQVFEALKIVYEGQEKQLEIDLKTADLALHTEENRALHVYAKSCDSNWIFQEIQRVRLVKFHCILKHFSAALQISYRLGEARSHKEKLNKLIIQIPPK